METPEPPSPLPEPSKLQKLRFDYAWKWFNFHADQRTKMFNFMLIGFGIFATAIVSAIEKKLLLEAMVLSGAAVLLAITFGLLDRRNRQLYVVAMDVLIDAEKTVVFGNEVQILDHKANSVDFGIARRIALEEKLDPAGLRGKWEAVKQGRHRYLMPFVAGVFAVLFGLAAVQAWLISRDLVRKSEPPMLVSGRFGGFGEGVELFDCNELANRRTVTKINAAIASTRERQLQAVVVLVGGTDRKPLSLALRRRFESNAGLARARVNEVEHCLDLAPAQTPGSAQRPPEVIRLITGASYTSGSQEGTDVVSKKMAEDREVRAFVIGVPTRDRF
jgi:hypothetical protein